jgi:radical SAM superfamily enzyme YgiQ (UPF0313 family)
MKINLIEACGKSDKGSIGTYYIKHHAEQAGYKIDINDSSKKNFDVELISLHHCKDFLRLAKMPKKATFRIVGGHPMQNNPKPVIPYADAVFLGEGESNIGNILKNLEKYKEIESLSDFESIIISKSWKREKKVPKTFIETELPVNPPYLNRPNTRSAAWYIEIARGCPFSCKFCELGHSTKFRKYETEYLKTVLNKCDLSKTRKINFYAPDEASHPGYTELYDYLSDKGFLAGFSSMRIESVLKNMPTVRKNQLIRVGIDGMSERLREKAGKNIKDDMIVEYFSRFIKKGHITFKMFFIFGYPEETIEDFNCFRKLMDRIFQIDLKKNVSLRIKWTPFIPQPCTPFKDLKPKYDFSIVQNIFGWHGIFKRPRRNSGWYVENDGLMNKNSHQLQCDLTTGNEDTLYRITKKERLWKI